MLARERGLLKCETPSSPLSRRRYFAPLSRRPELSRQVVVVMVEGTRILTKQYQNPDTAAQTLYLDHFDREA